MTAGVIEHRAISASAGSGKTFQLAHRYIELMAKGVAPDRIIALTFSRKAAGEIFDSVVRYLCQAASSPEAALRMGKLIRKPEADQREFLQVLRVLLKNLHRLHIGTLDSFTVGVARVFPMELGIPPHFQLLGEDGSAASMRQQVLVRMFKQMTIDGLKRRELLEAYRQATFGREEKGLGDWLDALVGDKRIYYQVLPSPDAWGREDCIWSSISPWWKDAGDVQAAADGLVGLLQRDRLPEGVMNRWRSFIDAVRRFGTASAWPEAIDYLFGKLSEGIGSLHAGDLCLKIDRVPQQLSREECRLVLSLMAHVVKTEIVVALQKTQGMYRVLDLYEQFYDVMVRQAGCLTFTDVQYLLTAGNRASGGSVISRLPSAEAHLYIDYRLDCKLDHWLLDEFQDTSDLQWEVLSNLVDEILQDNSGRRSFFYVGDTKQAIYGWRGGNARLFDRILDQYGDRIKLSHLSTSFRSCQAVIDVVNAVFGDIQKGLLPEGAVERWKRAWQKHQCEEATVPQNGYVAVIEPPCDLGDVKPGDEDRYRIAARLLTEIDPLRKGLSVAVLVRNNKSGEAIVDYLRRECGDMRIVHEGRASIKDNPVVSVLLSLVKFAAHPGDTFAWRHIQMSPLGRYLIEEGLDRDNLPLVLLRELQSCGFQSLVRKWGARLDTVHPLDEFGRKRLGELANAAIEFDQTGSRDCNAFLRFIDSYQMHDVATEQAVRVMTIHQSKGLGFDIVILPDLQSENMAGGSQPDFILARDPDTEKPLWFLQMPRRVVAASDPVLAEQLKISDETTAFEALCLLYVAMTRAIQGLYIITSFPGKASRMVTPAAFLKQQLLGDPRPVQGKLVRVGGEEAVCLYEVGDREWHAKELGKVKQKITVGAMELPPDFLRRPSIRQRLVHVQPSKRPEVVQRAAMLFAPASRDMLDLGTAIHQLFEKVTWVEETDVDDLVREWSISSPVREDLKEKAVGLFRQAIGAPAVRRVLTRPAGDFILWREKRFDMVIGRRWVSGVFDRVVVLRGRDGKAERATVLDFKSDEVPNEAAMEALAGQYRHQMELYRSVLSRMLGLRSADVELKLVFVYPAKVFDLD